MSPAIKAAFPCLGFAIGIPLTVAVLSHAFGLEWVPGTAISSVLVTLQLPGFYANMYAHYVIKDLKK